MCHGWKRQRNDSADLRAVPKLFIGASPVLSLRQREARDPAVTGFRPSVNSRRSRRGNPTAGKPGPGETRPELMPATLLTPDA
jgi:hypothetical protein